MFSCITVKTSIIRHFTETTA